VSGRIDCCRYEASLDELIDDDVMAPVLRSAGLDAQGLRDLIFATARRFDQESGEACRSERHAGRRDGRRANS
jgi:hypothetical protein